MMGKRTRKVLVGVVLACAVILTWADMASAEQTTWGYAREWLFLGPYINDSATRPSTVANMQMDFLTNGLLVTEDNFTPRPGATVATDYTVAGSSSYRDRQNGAPTPTVKYYMTGSVVTENVDLNVVYPSPNGTNPGNQNEDSMNYSWVYANNKTGAPLACYVGMSSDDGCQVKVNNVQIGAISVGRGITGAGAISNAYPCTLNVGVNKIMIKVFNGGTGYGVKMRVQTGTVLTPATAAEYIPPSRVELGFFDRTGVVSRTIAAPGTFSASLPLNITLTAIPVLGGAMTVRETMPTGWTPTFTPPAVGTAAFAAGVLTWTIPNLTTTSTLAYTLPPPPGDCTAAITFAGTFDAGTGWTNLNIGGTATATRVADRWQDAVLPWTNAEWISGPTSAEPLIGSVAYYSCNDSYLLTASGHDIWDNADDFEFLYATVTGVFQMQALVELTPGGTPPSTWSKAGIMARANNTDGSPNVIMFVTNTGPAITNGGDRQVGFQSRLLQDGVSDSVAAERAANNGTAIIRLERTAASGTSIIGGYDNGEGVVNWTFATRAVPNVPTATPILVGLALTSHLTGTNTTARYSNVTRTGAFPPPSTPPAAPSNLNVTQVAARLELTWVDNATNETGYKIERKTGVAGTYAEIAVGPANSPSYTDTNVVAGSTYYYRVRATNAAGDSAYSNEVFLLVTQALGARSWNLYEK